MNPHCQAWRCMMPVAAGVLMCRAHWRQVPGDLRSAVLMLSDDKNQVAYMKAAIRAIAAVAEKEAAAEWVEGDLRHARS